MPNFDPSRLNRLERDAWANFREKAGAAGAESMFNLMVQWVGILLSDGKTIAEIREKVVGTFYDNVALMRRGQSVRYETIALAKAMVEQAIDEFCRKKPSPASALEVIEIDQE